MKYKHLFGPVPSRRLGVSLGIDLVPPKVCSLNCVYCEVGKTTVLTTERKEYVPYNEIIEEISHYLSHNIAPDYITFSGSGEPTLNSRFGDVLRYIKEHTNIPVAVLTNGTLLYDKQVRKEMLPADLVLPSLDAAEKIAFLKLDRPYKHLSLEKYIEGLILFRQEYKGVIWLEIFLLSGYNDSRENLDKLKDAILKIRPDKVQLNTLDRPGAEKELRPMSRQEMNEIIHYWNLPNVEIISKAPSRKKITSYNADIENTILGLISRRPATMKDLQQLLGLHINEINKYLDVLEHEGKITHEFGDRGLFYTKTK